MRHDTPHTILTIIGIVYHHIARQRQRIYHALRRVGKGVGRLAASSRTHVRTYVRPAHPDLPYNEISAVPYQPRPASKHSIEMAQWHKKHSFGGVIIIITKNL